MRAERTWLADLQRRAARSPAPPELRLGIGDDAALLRPRPGHELVLTTDLMVEGVHFLRARDPSESCGRRLATRALSDLAAMGAQPLALLASCAFPADLPAAWSRHFMAGILAAAHEAGAVLAGGDLAAAPVLMFDIVGAGQVRAGRALRRDGAKPGDHLFVSGPLGAAARGRQLAHADRAPHSVPLNPEDRRAVARHRRPRARWELGQALTGVASAAIDISDGLSTDLHHLCQAGSVGATLDSAKIPRLRRANGLELALHGGEDYELLFAVPPRRLRRLPTAWPAIPIGVVTAARTILLDGRPLPDRGWQHFEPRR